MANNDERKERAKSLLATALGVGATATFLTRTSLGQDLATTGFNRLRSAFLKGSEELRGQTLKSMWGHAGKDFKKAGDAFKNGLLAPDINRSLPVSEHNLIGALTKRKQLIENRANVINKSFNTNFLPNLLRREVLGVLTHSSDELTQKRVREIVDDLLVNRDHYISSIDYDTKTPVFTRHFESKVNAHFGQESENVFSTLREHISRIEDYRKEYADTTGKQELEWILGALDNFETYQTKYSKNKMSNIALGGKSATVGDILDKQDAFDDIAIGSHSAINLLQEMVDIDPRFRELIVDPSLKLVDDRFLNYSAIKNTYEDMEDTFLRNAGRILKPIEVQRHIRHSPNFLYIPTGTIDYQLRAIAENKEGKTALDASYIHLFDKTYRINENGLEHIKELDNMYLTPSKGFEGQYLRHIAGNNDYNLNNATRNEFFEKLDIPGRITPKKLGKTKDIQTSYDRILLSVGNGDLVYQNTKMLVEDMNKNEFAQLPSLSAIEKLRERLSPLIPSATSRLDAILGGDEAVMAYLSSIEPKYIKGDLREIVKAYQANPIEALNKTYYHSKRKTSFLEEAKIELFKEATYASNESFKYGNMIGVIENSGLSALDLKKAKHLAHMSHLQQTALVNLKSPNVMTTQHLDGLQLDIINLLTDESHSSKDAQSYFKKSAEEQARKHLEDVYKESFLLDNVAVADRTNQYIHIKKGVINATDIIETINESTFASALQKVADIAKQYTAGRESLEDVTTQTLYPYFGLFRLQNDVKKARLNFSNESTKSVFDLAKNIVLKRALPLYALGFGISYLNYEAENFFGQSFTNMAAEATAKIDLGIRNTIDIAQNPLKDAHYWFTPFNYLFDDEYQNAEERKEWYETGYSPVKQSKFWLLGNSEFFGGRTLFYEPNYVKRTSVNWKDIGVYGSSKEKWQHSIIPTPRHPLSTIRYLTNPYWLEEKQALSRPYPVSGSMFDPNTPWGAFGNLTVGNLIKPPKRLNRGFLTDGGVDIRSIIEYENEKVKDKAKSQGTISVKSGDTAIESNESVNLFGGYSSDVASIQGKPNIFSTGGSGLGSYVEKASYSADYLSRAEKVKVFVADLTVPMRKRTLDQLEAMNYAIKEKAKWSYGNDTQFMVDIQNTKPGGNLAYLNDKNILSELRHLSTNEDMLLDLNYSIDQLKGVYNFLGNLVMPPKKRFAYARSSSMYATTQGFWDSGIDGADMYGANVMEIVRRFIPNEDRNRIRINPLKNNMPSWMPSRFSMGDPYTQIKKGEMRLPGPAYEALNQISPFDLTLGPSAVGKSQEQIIDALIGSKINKDSALLESADAGTALHKEYEQMLLDNGIAIQTEGLVEDTKNDIKGFYDALIRDASSPEGKAIMDIKTVSGNVFSQLGSEGANREHLMQTNYYLGLTGLSKGYVHYINRDNPNQMMTFDIHFSQRIYNESLNNVQQARKTLLKMVQKGVLSPYELYSDMDRFKILADVAPGSAEYKKYKELIEKTGSPEELEETQGILKRVEEQSKKHKFFNYKFTNVNIDKKHGIIESIYQDQIKLVGDDVTYRLAGLRNYNQKVYDYLAPGMKVQLEYEKNYAKSKYIQAGIYASGLNVNRQMMRDGVAERHDDGTAMATRALLTRGHIALGKPFEILSHLPIPILHNKFLKVNTPYESWMQENIYGSKFSNWEHPIETIIKPAFQNAWGSSYTQGILGAGLFALNHFFVDDSLSKLQRSAVKWGHLAFTPGAFAGELIERVVTLNSNIFKNEMSGKGAMIGSMIGLGGFMLNNAQNPLFATASGAGLGYTFSKFWDESLSGKNGAIAGLIGGLTLSAIQTDGFQLEQINKKYIPREVKKRWGIEEYFDRLEYLKYKGLYEKAARLALDKEGVPIDSILDKLDKNEKNQDKGLKKLYKQRNAVANSLLSEDTKRTLLDKLDNEIYNYVNPSIDVPATPYTRLALGYKQAMESTVYGLDENSSWAQILRALEPYERDYFIEFAKETNPRKQKEILKSISPYKRKILQNAWGKKSDKTKNNNKYFLSHRLPGTLWKGWNAEKSLDAYKIKTIKNEGMMLSDFGYYDSELDKPEIMQANSINYNRASNLLITRSRMVSILGGLGITDNEISVLPSMEPGIKTVINVATVNIDKAQQAIGDLGRTLFF